VTAVVWAGLGDTETGNALVGVLYGAVNPSRCLPYPIGMASLSTQTICAAKEQSSTGNGQGHRRRRVLAGDVNQR
jgi:hypothetical protein